MCSLGALEFDFCKIEHGQLSEINVRAFPPIYIALMILLETNGIGFWGKEYVPFKI